MGRYEIRWSDGWQGWTYDSIGEAEDAIRERYPEAEIGHDGDLSEGGDQTLAWATADEAEGDDGRAAVASIRDTEALRG